MRFPLIRLALILVLLPAALLAADIAPREFVPVQDGYRVSGEMTLPYAPDRILVKLTPEALEASSLPAYTDRAAPVASTGLVSLDALSRAEGLGEIRRPYTAQRLDLVRSLGVDRWLLFEFGERAELPGLAERLAADRNVEAVSLDWRAYPAVAPNDPYYPEQWGHNNTAQMASYDWNTYSHTGPDVGLVGFDSNAEAAWDDTQGYGSASVVIAILDSGVDADHPDLRQVTGYDFGSGDSNPDDNSGNAGHGTACAGVAAGISNNNLGVSGIAGGCSIMPLKVANNAGSMYFSYIQNALYFAADNGAHVASMSFSAPITSDPATDAALEYAHAAGVTLLAATSNDNASHIEYPANHADVIGVGAASPCGDRKRSSSNPGEVNSGVSTDPNGYTCDGERWWGSNYGVDSPDAAGAVDVIAPTIMPTTDIGGSAGYASGDYSMWFNGTSCATPYAAGVCGLIISANPSFTPDQVRERLVSSAQDVVNVESGAGWDRYSGYGMVDADAAVAGSNPVPVAQFSGTPLSGMVPLNVSFTDASSNADSYSWTFGDGGTSTAQNPSHTYDTAGTYTVSLTVTNAYGSDTETKTNYITVTQPTPVADFSGTPTSGLVPLDVSFTDASEYATGWDWDFGDGNVSDVQNPTHTYNAVGVYTVSLSITGPYGGDTETKTGYITVTEPTPVADFTGSPLSGDMPLEVSFTDASQFATSWAWTFGDGGTSTAQNPVHTYTAAGVYDVSLTINGGDDTETKLGYVTVFDPTSGSTALAEADLPVYGTVNGSYLNTQAADGSYEVLTEEIYVKNPRKRYSRLEHQWRFSVTSGSAVTFEMEAYRPANGDGDNFLFEYSTDGVNYAALVTVASATEQLYTASLPASTSGTVYVRVTDTNRVYEAESLDALYVDYLAIVTAGSQPSPPVANFSGSPTSGYAPLSVDFTDLSSNGPTSWSWNFGDGNTSTEANPTHVYSAPDTYTVSLTVSNAYGSDSETKTGYITVNENSGGGTMHVFDMVVGRKVGGPFARGTVTVIIEDDGSQPVEGATVYVTAAGPVSGNYSGVTGADGSVYMETGKTRTSSGEWCFTVTNVTHASLDYDPGANLVTESCEGGDVRDANDLQFQGQGFALLGNYPDPFNPVTEIAFSLPEAGQARLQIFSVTGQRVAVLIDGHLEAGVHRYRWDAREATSGVYFYRLETPEFSDTRKMVLLK